MPNDVLLVEDNMIITLGAEEMLCQLGVSSVRTASTVVAALQLLEKQRPEFAVLDVNLGDETSFGFDVADRLTQLLSVALVFATGYGEQIAFPKIYARAPRFHNHLWRKM
jgi:CheY-like chemotaxis protein